MYIHARALREKKDDFQDIVRKIIILLQIGQLYASKDVREEKRELLNVFRNEFRKANIHYLSNRIWQLIVLINSNLRLKRKGCFSPYGDADAGATVGANTWWVEEVTRYLKRVISSPSSFSSPWRPPLSTFHSRLECHPLQPLPPPLPPPKLHPGIAGKTDTLLYSRRRFIYYPRLLQRTAASDQLSVQSSPRVLDAWSAYSSRRETAYLICARAAFFADWLF